MLSGKRQHWVGLSKKSRKALERFPFKDFAILVLIAIIVTMAWTWYDSSVLPKTPQWVEHQKGLDELKAMRAMRKDRPDLTDETATAQQIEIGDIRSNLLSRLKLGDPPTQTHEEALKDLRAQRKRAGVQ